MEVLFDDNHALVRRGLPSVMAAYNALQAITEDRNGAEAVKLAGDLRPQVAVMDINMPRMNGIDATAYQNSFV
ncbi:MAG: response regulator [Nitrospira sp.]|nr:response regulator [Nitrospira sp.]